MSPEAAHVPNAPARPLSHARPPARRPSPPSSSMGLYLRDIRRTRLLTAQEEIDLALRIEKGDEDARKSMIESNLRLVVRIAKRYVNRGLTFMDLVEEGNVGLIKAVERFKASKGNRFATYASWWIRQSIERALTNQVRTIRLPVRVSDDLDRMTRAGEQLRRKLGRTPTRGEVAEEIGFPPEYVQRLGSIRRKILSIDQALDVDGDFTLQQNLEAFGLADPAEEIQSKEVRRFLRSKLGTLKKREKRILTMRFGLENDEPMTLEGIGRVVGVTRERIRQIQAEALGKLRASIEDEGIHFHELV